MKIMSFLLVCVLMVECGASWAQQAPKTKFRYVLDLTAPRPSGDKDLGIPGAGIRGIAGVPNPPLKIDLPLEITILSVQPTPVGRREKFQVEVALRNSGSTPFEMPMSLDLFKVHRPGNLGQRQIVFFSAFPDVPSNGPVPTIVVLGSASGSESVKNTLVSLLPGESMLVKLQGDLTPLGKWIVEGGRRVNLRVFCRETFLEADRYYQKTPWLEGTSQNSVELHIKEMPPAPVPH